MNMIICTIDPLKEALVVGKVIKEKEIIVENEHDKTIDPLNKALVAKVIKEKENEITKLRSENESLMELNNKISRCAIKMDQEIKELRSKMN